MCITKYKNEFTTCTFLEMSYRKREKRESR